MSDINPRALDRELKRGRWQAFVEAVQRATGDEHA